MKVFIGTGESLNKAFTGDACLYIQASDGHWLDAEELWSIAKHLEEFLNSTEATQ